MASILGTTAVAALAVAGILRLPGGTIESELRWSLRRSGDTMQNLNHAYHLLLEADERRPGARAALYRDLLNDDDRHIVYHTLFMLAHDLRFRGDVDPPLIAVYEAWFEGASESLKIDTLPVSMQCHARVCMLTHPLSDWGLLASSADVRWILAATGERSLLAGNKLPPLILRHEPPRAGLDSVFLRLLLLDGIRDSLVPVPSTVPAKVVALTPADIDAELVVSHADLLDALLDSRREVRWGAARLLVVAGDRRGGVAFMEWHRARRQLEPMAAQMLARLYGEDWRDALARSDSTRS